MEIDQPGAIMSLEQIRATDGNEACISAFDKMRKSNRQKALAQLNDDELTFPTLYILIPGMGELSNMLNRRNMTAVRIINEISKADDKTYIDLSVKSDTVYYTLLWLLNTGANEHSLDDRYRKVMDIVCSVLLDTYGDRSILPTVCSMIFERKKRSQSIHDLVWAYFRVKDAGAIRLVADRLGSEDESENELAHSLLNINEGVGGDTGAPTDSAGYADWLEENEGFLYFTGMGYQYASNPVMWGVDHARKAMRETAGTEGSE